MNRTQSCSRFANTRGSRRGVAAIWALVVLAVLMVVVELLTIQTVTSIRQADHRHYQIQALWLARSGVESAAARLLANPANYRGETRAIIPKSLVRIDVLNDSAKPDIFQITCEARYPTDAREAVLRSQTLRFRRVTEKNKVRLEAIAP